MAQTTGRAVNRPQPSLLRKQKCFLKKRCFLASLGLRQLSKKKELVPAGLAPSDFDNQTTRVKGVAGCNRVWGSEIDRLLDRSDPPLDGTKSNVLVHGDPCCFCVRNISDQCGFQGCRVGEASNPGLAQMRNASCSVLHASFSFRISRRTSRRCARTCPGSTMAIQGNPFCGFPDVSGCFPSPGRS